MNHRHTWETSTEAISGRLHRGHSKGKACTPMMKNAMQLDVTLLKMVCGLEQGHGAHTYKLCIMKIIPTENNVISFSLVWYCHFCPKQKKSHLDHPRYHVARWRDFQFRISQHWFWQCVCSEQVTRHFFNSIMTYFIDSCISHQPFTG